MELLQIDRLNEEGDYWHEVAPSHKQFGFANGQNHKCHLQVSQEFAYGLLAGESITLQILDQPGNSTAPLLSIADLATLGAVLDLANSTISIRGRKPVKVAKSRTGLTIIPVTKSACERWDAKLKTEEASFASVSEETPAPCEAFLGDEETESESKDHSRQ